MIQPPVNIEAESAVIASCLIDKDSLCVVDILSPTDFYSKRNRDAFAVIRWLVERGDPVDLVSVTDKLGKDGRLDAIGGSVALSQVLDTIPQASNIEHHARLILEAKAKRELLQRTINIQKDIQANRPFDELLDSAQSSILSVDCGSMRDDTVCISDIISGEIDHLEDIGKIGGSVTGVPTGIKLFDSMTSGLQPGDLIILAARPSMGKTALAFTFARNMAKAGYGSLIFELEMSNRPLFHRICAAEAGINVQKFRNGDIQPHEWKRITEAAANISDWKIFLNDQFDQSHKSILRISRKIKRQHKIDVIMIDYLQLIRGEKGLNRDQEIGSITRGCKRIAKDLGVPVVLLSQLNRDLESRTDKRPQLSDLRESGNIEQDADVVCFIYRDEVYNRNENNPNKGVAELILAKQRTGPIGSIRTAWLPHFTRFENLER